MMYFTAKSGFKEPQNLQNRRVVRLPMAVLWGSILRL